MTPRVTGALYLRDPSTGAGVGATKLTFNAGTGIKAPSISQELSSLYAIVQASGSAAVKAVSPIGPERNRSVDLGVEQSVWSNRAAVRAAFFDNQFSNLIEFVGAGVLPELGVDAAAAAATGFGAYTNSSSFWTRGVETFITVSLRPEIMVSASYTHMAARVTKSFASGALEPAFNPAFPTIPIGAFGPLVGARPFHRPANTGNVLVGWSTSRASLAIAAFFAGKSDDSTFLEDGFFGNSMLLPNHNLDAAYQKVDLSGSYQVLRRVRWYITIENLANQRYEAAFGFPALPRTVRTGATVVLGGNSRRGAF